MDTYKRANVAKRIPVEHVRPISPGSIRYSKLSVDARHFPNQSCLLLFSHHQLEEGTINLDQNPKKSISPNLNPRFHFLRNYFKIYREFFIKLVLNYLGNAWISILMDFTKSLTLQTKPSPWNACSPSSHICQRSIQCSYVTPELELHLGVDLRERGKWGNGRGRRLHTHTHTLSLFVGVGMGV